MTMSSTKKFIVTGLGPVQIFDLYDEAFVWAKQYSEFKFGKDSNLRCRFKILEFDTKVVYEGTGDTPTVQR